MCRGHMTFRCVNMQLLEFWFAQNKKRREIPNAYITQIGMFF